MLRATVASVSPRASRARDAQPSVPSSLMLFVRTRVLPYLQVLSRQACNHPIHTLVLTAILASTTYIALLESSLFDPPPTAVLPPGQLDLGSFLAGSRTLYADKSTEWRWQNGDSQALPALKPVSYPRCSLLAVATVLTRLQAPRHHSLMTLVFPDSIHDGVQVVAPNRQTITSASNTTFDVLPASKNLLSPISQETTLAFAVPYVTSGDFLSSIQELPVFQGPVLAEETLDEQQAWIMSAKQNGGDGARRSFKNRTHDAWTAFTDLLKVCTGLSQCAITVLTHSKNAEELDIMIMVLGYVSMHLTFVSLFMSMRRLGSNFWLGTSVLLSSVFALLFGLIVTIKMGVPLNMVLLSEGLPFLVVIIGFEKPITLTKAVLSASLALKRPSTNGASNQPADSSSPSPTIQSAINIAVREKGFEIIRDYGIEILILVAGAVSGVQGGLCQFCFLAAWILFFDCLLLFTFYTSILTIKLEINRIKRHVALRRALEEDGVSRRVAEEVAAADEWPGPGAANVEDLRNPRSSESTIFGMKARDSSISKFKVLMVAGFIGINLINFITIPFRSGARSTGSALSSAVTQPPMDPFKVASNGLDQLLANAKRAKIPAVVTVMVPIKYELKFRLQEDTASMFDMDFADQLLDGFGGRVVDSILKSFEDPFLSKWIIIALVMSLVLNGYLFNAARWSIKEATQPALNGAATAPAPKKAPAEMPSQPVDQAREAELKKLVVKGKVRTSEECEMLVANKQAASLEDEELVLLTSRGKIRSQDLEKIFSDNKARAVKIRRSVIARTAVTKPLSSSLETSETPYLNYNYDYVYGACCENVIGYLPLPLGVAGPMVIDGKNYWLPMATTEGVLVASTSRGAKAVNAGGGAVTVLTGDGMTRGPCVGFATLARAGEAKIWLDSDDGQRVMKDAFNSTSRFARLQSLKTALAGTYLYIRFRTTTGDAMGMNMISKGCEKALQVMSEESGFDDMNIISLSGNYCIDKKPSAINWIEGRGKSVVAEAIIPAEVVHKVLKSNVDALVELNLAKNFIGSALAGSIGGNNAHAANIVTAMFLATGQDPAQNVESSNCMTVMKK